MDEASDKYKAYLSEIIAKQAVILGQDIAVLKARTVDGLEVADDGTVTSITGDPTTIAQEVVDIYVQLSGQIVKNALSSVFTKYPELQKDGDAE